ncbi:MAG: hypothetical protein HYY30_08440 [Chloroflexi bacterium]|nr:hypothetical protein [Chloroflexota bacterium]
MRRQPTWLSITLSLAEFRTRQMPAGARPTRPSAEGRVGRGYTTCEEIDSKEYMRNMPFSRLHGSKDCAAVTARLRVPPRVIAASKQNG